MSEHPLYAEATLDERTGLMQLDDVGLCSLWALDAFALMRMALQLNDLDQATHLESEIVELADRMNMWFWDPDLGQFRSRNWKACRRRHKASPRCWYCPDASPRWRMCSGWWMNTSTSNSTPICPADGGQRLSGLR